MIRLGILSFAHHHGEAYISSLRRMDNVELVGVVDDEALRGQTVAAHNRAQYFHTYEDLLEEQPDGVIICTENNRHRPIVEMAASRGVHVLCEKPLATTLEDARAIVDVCENAGVLLMTAFPMRFSAPLREIKARLDNGDFGDVYCFNAANPGELPTKHRAWFVDSELAGGGAIMDHTVHLVDIMRWLTGSEVKTVYARSNRIFHADEVEVETGALEMLTFENDVFATIDASWSRPQYWPTWGGLTFEMVTQRGAVVVDAFRQNLNVYRHDWGRSNWTYWGSDMNHAMLSEFAAAIRENRPAKVTGLDGLRAVEATLAAYESDRTGRTVEVKMA
ncbi:MAG TPA: Gfo/Idh/MocA family oxidoreductase [Anaerolineales bacterium]|nr:Gfo/Idh/MocA family oxidoreductase [Anaerolineales bacterium]